MSTVCYWAVLAMQQFSIIAAQHPDQAVIFQCFSSFFPEDSPFFLGKITGESPGEFHLVSSEASDMEDDQDDFTDEADVASRGFTPQVENSGGTGCPIGIITGMIDIPSDSAEFLFQL